LQVVITDGNERSALAVTRALGRQGITVIVGAESQVSLAGTSKYCGRSFAYPDPYGDPGGFTTCLLETVRDSSASALFPVSDIALQLVGLRKAEFEEWTNVPIPSLQAYENLSDKYHLMELAAQLGIPIPETEFVAGGHFEGAIDGVRQYPVVVKPARSLLRQGGRWEKTSVHHAMNGNQLRQLFGEKQYLQDRSLIQQRIIGAGQGLFVLMDRGDPVCVFAHRRLRERPPSGGVSVLRESIVPPKDMADFALRLLRHVGWHGVAMVEFKVDDRTGVPLLIEVNGRFWGSLQLAVDAGVNFPMLLSRMASERLSDEPDHGYKIGIKSRWFLGDVDHLLLRLMKPERVLNLPFGSPSRWRSIVEFCRFVQPDLHYEVERQDDMRPAIYEWKRYIGNLCHGWRARVKRIAGPIWRNASDPYMAIHRMRIRLIGRMKLEEQLIYSRLPSDVGHMLFVCKGNICRSPLAAAYMRARMKQEGRYGVIDSAGLETTEGKGADPSAKLVAQRHGLSLDSHKTKKISEVLVDQADLILVMEPAQQAKLIKSYPGTKGKVFLLGCFEAMMSADIGDPHSRPIDDFELCYSRLCESCNRLLAILSRSKDTFAPVLRERFDLPPISQTPP
jgi:protein-tyrosine-phosphatase/predicted ATP-grasp superfamily ATP-dependent carboligase